MNMDCLDVRQKISFLPRAELSAQDRQQVIEHISDCQICRTEYSDYLRTFYLIDQTVILKPPQHLLNEFSQSVISRIALQKSAAKSQTSWKKGWAIAATLILSIAGGLYFWQFTPAIYNRATHVTKLQPISIASQRNEIKPTINNSSLQLGDACERKIPVSMVLNKLYRLRHLLADTTTAAWVEPYLKNQANYASLISEVTLDFRDPRIINAVIVALEKYSIHEHSISVKQLVTALTTLDKSEL